jgi:hypothetical protein
MFNLKSQRSSISMTYVFPAELSVEAIDGAIHIKGIDPKHTDALVAKFKACALSPVQRVRRSLNLLFMKGVEPSVVKVDEHTIVISPVHDGEFTDSVDTTFYKWETGVSISGEPGEFTFTFTLFN